MEVELVKWDPQLAMSSVEASAIKDGCDPHFRCLLPSSWIKSHELFEEFNRRSPYISPYTNNWMDEEKSAVGMVHELLSLTLWKKLSIMKLEHFKREFGLPEQLNRLLFRHTGIFYVSNRCSLFLYIVLSLFFMLLQTLIVGFGCPIMHCLTSLIMNQCNQLKDHSALNLALVILISSN
jgi:Plant organelle RNA recognition domain